MLPMALAVLVTFFDDHYRQVLQMAPGGIRGALYPYRVVAAVGGLAATTAMTSQFLYGELKWDYQQGLALAIPTGMTAWALFGTYSLVDLTLFHGEKRADLLGGLDRARLLLHDRKKQKSA